MAAAATLADRFRTPEYRAEYERQQAELAGLDDDALVRERLLPDPDAVRIRTYATQSTHKTLTSLRQGSMIHVFDEDFHQSNEEAFHEAYMTHTSTSPNYQVLASLDVGRRQVELEGFELVQRQVELSMTVRDRIAAHPLLSKYFRVLGSSDLIPDQYRPWGRECPLHFGPVAMEQAWGMDEFVLDACRLTIQICATGIDGDTFKHEFLMDRWGIQVNKTSRNTVLAMTNIGTTRSSVAYLLEALLGIAEGLESDIEQMGPLTKQAFTAPGQVVDLGPPAAARLLRVPRRVPGQPGRGGRATATCARPTSWPTGTSCASTCRRARPGTGWRPGSRWCRRSS